MGCARPVFSGGGWRPARDDWCGPMCNVRQRATTSTRTAGGAGGRGRGRGRGEGMQITPAVGVGPLLDAAAKKFMDSFMIQRTLSFGVEASPAGKRLAMVVGRGRRPRTPRLEAHPQRREQVPAKTHTHRHNEGQRVASRRLRAHYCGGCHELTVGHDDECSTDTRHPALNVRAQPRWATAPPLGGAS